MATNAKKIQEWRDDNPDDRLTESTLRDLIGQHLRSANLRSADLRYANLWGADLRGADLWGANLRSADLRYANLWGADLRGADLWGGFRLDGLRSGQVTMIPTPAGWDLRVGCFHDSVDALEEIATGDDGWPEATGDERERRRPGLQALIPLLRAHQEYHADKLQAVIDYWKDKEN